MNWEKDTTRLGAFADRQQVAETENVFGHDGDVVAIASIWRGNAWWRVFDGLKMLAEGDKCGTLYAAKCGAEEAVRRLGLEDKCR